MIEARKVIIELLLADHPDDCLYCVRSGSCKLQKFAQDYGIRERIFKPRRRENTLDVTSPAIVFDQSKCILCGKCVRTCNEIRRSYLAVVRGCFPQKAQIYADPIGRDRHDARRMILHPKGISAWTKAVLLRYCKKKDRSLIRCTLGSGRTHQIRVHLSGHGYPLVNDPLYGGHRGNTIGRMALHSAQVSFYHPLLQQSVEINCPLPDDLEN